MDYQGQELCEQLYQIIIALSGVIGFSWGYIQQTFWLTFLWCAGGFVVASLVCVPDWPMYRRHPLAWQPHQLMPGEKDTDGNVVPDTNKHCGTCACGTSVHGVECESHPDASKTAVEVAGAEGAGAEAESKPTQKAETTPPAAVTSGKQQRASKKVKQ